MALKNLFKKEMSKDKKYSSDFFDNYIHYYRTGIDVIDYVNGFKSTKNKYCLGLPSGRAAMYVGISGSAKTTIAIQTAVNIASQFENSDIVHLDFERSTTKERVMALANWTEEEYETKYTLITKKLSAETLYDSIKSLERIKLENYNDLKLPTGEVDADGKEIFMLPPTIVLLDSIPMMAPEEIEDSEELKGGMGAVAIAKVNTNIFKRISGSLENANIILLEINHITQAISINPMQPVSKVLNFLKQGESLPGGKAVTYLANTLFKFVPGKEIKPDEGLKIKGLELNGILVKSRANTSGLQFKLIFDQAKGIDNILTNFTNLKDNKMITGAGRSWKLESYPDVKFAQADFKNKYLSDLKFKEAVDIATHELYSQYLSNDLKEKWLADVDSDDLVLVDAEQEIYTQNGKYYQKQDDGTLMEVVLEEE